MNKILESYIEGITQAGNIIKQENPDYLIAPMCGSIPFIDALNLVDDDFDSSMVVYMPASSKIDNVNQVIQRWYYNFLNKNVDPNYNFPKIMGIDEVVSGQSVIRCFKSIDVATQRKRNDIKESLIRRLQSKDTNESTNVLDEIDILTDNVYSSELTEFRENILNRIYKNDKLKTKEDLKFVTNILRDCLSDKLVYKSIGIEDSKRENRVNKYENLKKEGRIIPISIKSIITMDKPEYCPAQFYPTERSNENFLKFSPIVKEIIITQKYMEFLTNIAKVVGKNPIDIRPVNMNSIIESSKYLI